ncbi:response regulator transcription factor [Candidatus Magnetomonas plexicatena]|uniref:response regulator transcription factor n=1 Tax=Candidatus Magnetomonas plexicatena TaxID=2552947 RepID=UPI001100E3E8|nr:response regulator [Nitrospirales bacterium LBB_01]
MTQNDELLKSVSVLYVEDEASIRAMITRFLKKRVAVIYEASNGSEGLDIYNSNKTEIDLVITDIQMPVMDGMTMINEILKIDENQPIIITTAYNDEQHTSDRVCRNVIKPIKLENLLESVMFCVWVR